MTQKRNKHKKAVRKHRKRRAARRNGHRWFDAQQKQERIAALRCYGDQRKDRKWAVACDVCGFQAAEYGYPGRSECFDCGRGTMQHVKGVKPAQCNDVEIGAPPYD